MSLLMKALASAEKEKKGKAPRTNNAENVNPKSLELVSLDADSPLKAHNVSPFPQTLAKPLIVTQYLADASLATSQPEQQAAANIFNAARLPTSYFPRILLGLTGVTLGLFIWLGIQFLPLGNSNTQLLVSEKSVPSKPSPVVLAPNVTPPTVVEKQVTVATNPPAKENAQPTRLFAEQNSKLIDTEPKSASPILTATSDSFVHTSASAATPTQSALQLSHTKSAATVDPVLLSAYQAFNQGELSLAQQLYRQVLQKDVRNMDALLGMAAIAQRQARNSDALGWYQKVLEIDPTQPFALSAVLALQPAMDSESQISRLKNLIAQQPENVQFHASLGNLYAEQNRWQEAQAAYFDAARFAPQSAEYVFNLAVSLEHLNQPQLALTQYQRALQLVERTGVASPDPLTLKNRILALQPAP